MFKVLAGSHPKPETGLLKWILVDYICKFVGASLLDNLAVSP